MKLTDLPQFKRNAKRFEQILRVLTRYGLANWIKPEFQPDFISKRLTGPDGEDLSALSEPERIRMAMTELGTTFIKLGQMLSTRADIVGPELAKELVKLQANTPADSPETVRATIHRELGRPVEEAFARFTEEPIASASIAQAHFAELQDGTQVVVKVQHEGIEDKVINDLEILVALAEFAEQHSTELRLYQPRATLAAFQRNLLAELDFGREEQNLLRFRTNFETEAMVHIPAPFPEVSAKRILTMERLDGVSVAKTDVLDERGADRKELARRGINLYLDMIFRDKLYHADPHPGNILVLEEDVIGLLDFGMVGQLDDRTRDCFEGLIHGFLMKDSDQLTEYCLKLGTAPPTLDRDDLQGEIEQFVAANLGGSMKEFDISRTLDGFTDLVRRHRIVQNPNVSLLVKVLIMLEGTGRLLDPDFSLGELLQPYYKKMVERKLSPENVLKSFQKTFRDWDQFAKALPRDLADIFQRIRKGTLDVHLEHRRLDAVVNRITYGIVTAALFLGSTQLWSREIPPVIWGTSLPGVAGCAVAVWLAINLLRAIKKSGGIGPGEE